MPLDPLAIDQITEADLRELIGTPEGRDIDFKLETWGDSPEAKREFLADISSFANMLGGHIVIGMREDPATKTAVELVGVEIVLDKERQRLESCALTGLRPRLGPLQIHAVPLANGRQALVARVARSFNPPHRVTRDNSNRFWARHTGGKYEPDVDQLRELFAVAPTIAERIRDFRFDRLAKIQAGETPVPLPAGDVLVLHIVPFAATTGRRIPAASELASAEQNFKPMRANSAAGSRFNLDGIVVFAGGNPGERSAYTQLWRTGQVEAVRARIVSDRSAPYEPQPSPTVVSRDVERNVIDGVRRYLPALAALGVLPPYAVLMSLLGVREVSYDRPTMDEIDDGEAKLRRFDRDVAAVREVQIESVPATWDDQTVAALLRPAFDEIANAAGLLATPNFDQSGRWRG